MNALAWMAVGLGCAATFDDLRRREVAITLGAWLALMGRG
jgi:hypothetical protein